MAGLHMQATPGGDVQIVDLPSSVVIAWLHQVNFYLSFGLYR